MTVAQSGEQRLIAAGHRFDQHHAFAARHRTLIQPVPLRLKEPEALKKVTEKIDKLTVFGGLDGVLKQLVSLKQ